MPMLKKRPFVRAPVPTNIRDDEEVFHCSITDEIFRDYEEFTERIILCNSMVWTCAMTGKSNLTYSEALESEENAKLSLKDFSVELRPPLLYIATLTVRSSFHDMTEDVYQYVKDRYFVGEKVEAYFSGNKWKEYEIRQVIAPTEDQLKGSPKNGNVLDRFHPPYHLYRYEVVKANAEDEDISESMIVDHNQVRRKKGTCSREKSKIFLKQHVEHLSSGLWAVKDSSLEEFGIKKMKFGQIFDGPPPCFDPSKKMTKILNGKKPKQETIAKYLTKNGIVVPPKKALSEEEKRKREEEKKRKEEEKRRLEEERARQKAEDKEAEKQRRKEENNMIATLMRDWYKPKEDLILEDHKKLPEPTPVVSKIPEKYFGDVLMIMEFVHTFSKFLSTSKFFPGGLTLQLMERALTKDEVAGPLMDIIQMLLIALFNLEDAEKKQYKITVEKLRVRKEPDPNGRMSLTEATYFASYATRYPSKYLGFPLSHLPIYIMTVSEILRLHLLSSGARMTDLTVRWRYQERGGYFSEDDPGLHFRLKHPRILKALALYDVAQLPAGDKIKVISCLMNQILTYEEIRDVIEEKLELARQAKIDLRGAQAAERKREAEHVAAKLNIRREAKEGEDIEAKLAKLDEEAEDVQARNYQKIQALMKKAVADNPVVLGFDRAFRKYLKLSSVPGFFVEHGEEPAGVCLDEPVVQKPELVNMDRNATLKYIRRTLQNNNVKGQAKLQFLNGAAPEKKSDDKYEELLICSAEPETCPVHSPAVRKRRKWGFYYKVEEVEELLACLNKRGIRENELEQAMQIYKESIHKAVGKTPFSFLNPALEPQEEDAEVSETTTIGIQTRHSANKPRKKAHAYPNLGYPQEMEAKEVYHTAVTDIILEIEDKIFSGHLGSVRVKDRDHWRQCLETRNYEEFLQHYGQLAVNGKQAKLENGTDDTSDNDKDEDEDKEKDKLDRPDSPTDDILVVKNVGMSVGPTLDDKNLDENSSDSDVDETLLNQPEELQKAIRCLSMALNQVAQGVSPMYMNRPLGNIYKKNENKNEPSNKLPMWEQSLLTSTSFSQIFLHYGTLDSCIKWSDVAWKAICRMCRSPKDSENMLLCDSCNKGHHLYCLKPKLKSVPEGKWFCDKCKKELGIEEVKPEPVKKKKRKLLTVEDGDDLPPPPKLKVSREEEEEEEGNEGDDERMDSDYSVKDEEDEDDDEDEDNEEGSVDEDRINGNLKIDLCYTCGSGGELLYCKTCANCYHIECVEPPLKRHPRGPWFCNDCRMPQSNKRTRERRHVNNGVNSHSQQQQRQQQQQHFAMPYERCCAAKARNKIHDFAKSLRHASDSEDSETEDNSTTQRRSRRDEDFPLHNATLQELLSEIMKHEDAWPFIRPVQKIEVPDYYDIISKPMDFGTIKYKLNMGNYREDAEFMTDAALVFDNCNTYNNSEAQVYKCGQNLLKFFREKCESLGLKLPEGIMNDDDDDEIKDVDEEELENGVLGFASEDDEPILKKQRT